MHATVGFSTLQRRPRGVDIDGTTGANEGKGRRTGCLKVGSSVLTW